MADGLNLEAERAAFEAWFGKPLMNPEQPSHFNGSAARKAWEAWLESGNRRTPPAPSTAPSDELPKIAQLILDRYDELRGDRTPAAEMELLRAALANKKGT